MTSLRYQALQRLIARILIAAMVLAQVPQAVAFTPAVAPLAATTTSVVRPNLMYVLDDSGSMAWDYTPDYINDATTAADPGSTGGSAGDGALATINAGTHVVTAINPDGSPATFSHKYKTAPQVVIEGTTGTGASATANWNASTQLITSITVNSGGSNYTTVPHVALVGPVVNATWGMCWGTTGTSNQGGAPKDTSSAPTCTTPSQLPYATSTINYQSYDPSVRYERPLKADGTRYGSVEGTTTNWTAAKSDGYAASSTTTNLTTSYQHEVWCNSSTAVPTASDPTGGGKCKENTNSAVDPTTSGTASLQYTTSFYPNATYTFRKTYNGPAFYFVMRPSEFCTDSTLTNCVRATTGQVVGSTIFNVPAYYRWCAYYNPVTHTYGQCQARRDLTHYIPNYLGGWVSTGAAGAQASATLVINATTAGQQITGVKIGGADVVGGQTFASTANGDQNTIAQQICTAINGSTSTSGFGCSVSGSSVTIQSAMVGTAANGLQVLAEGPASVAATNAIGKITVKNPVTSGYKINSILIVRSSDGTSQELLTAPVTSDGNVGNTAKAICDAINGGADIANYEARSGVEADPSLKYPSDPTKPPAAQSCQVDASGSGYVGIRRRAADTRDNGASIVVSGPPTGTQYSGSITINTTAGDTRINDITINGTTVLPGANKPLTYPSGSISSGADTALIAGDIAAKITAGGLATGCTVTASSSTITFRGTTGLCGAANPIAVVATAAQATGKFRVASTGNSAGANLGGIQLTASTQSSSTPNLLGAFSVTDGTAVATNASQIASAITAYPSTTYSATAAANGSYYDVTVTAPAGGTDNGRTFNFLNGSVSSGVTGQPSIWSFQITGASTDNKNLTSIDCGGTTAVGTRNTGTVSSSNDRVRNLGVALNGQTTGTYSYSCAPSGSNYRCTLTDSSGSNACNSLTITKDTSISISNDSVAHVAGNPASKQWTFTLDGASTDSKSISGITCSGSTVLSSAVGTGTPSSYASTLATGTNGLCNQGTYGNYTWTGSGTTCQLQGPTGPTTCTPLVLTNVSNGAITLTQNSFTNGTSGTPETLEQWKFDITNATTDNKTITSIKCDTSEILNQNVSTGSTFSGDPAATLAAQIQTQQRTFGLDNKFGQLAGGCSKVNSNTINCQLAMTPAIGGTARTRCTANTLAITLGSSGITVAAPSSNPGGTKTNTTNLVEEWDDGSRYWYAFDLTGITSGKVLPSIICSGESGEVAVLNAGTGVGTDQAADRIANLAATLPGEANSGYAMSCADAASAGSHHSKTCTVTMQSGQACSTVTVTKDSSITISSTTKTVNHVAGTAGTRPTWSIGIGVAAGPYDSQTINSITCGGTDTFNTANKPNTGTYQHTRINNLGTGLNNSSNWISNWSSSCTPTNLTSSSSPMQSTCTVTGPTSAACSNLSITHDSSISVQGTTASPTNSGSAASVTTVPSTWTFDITGASSNNKQITNVQCPVGTSRLPTSVSTGVATSSVAQRINNLTGATTNPSASGSLTSNGYTLSCTPATTGTPTSDCTLTGPQSAPACGTDAASNFTITKDSSITFGTVTRTQDGRAATTGGIDMMSPTAALTNLTAFSGGYAAQLTAKSDLTGVSTGTIDIFGSSSTTTTATTITSSSTMSGGSGVSVLTIPSNATGEPGAVLTMSGGVDTDTSTNHWKDVGLFSRVDIVATTTSYNRASGRTDCAGSTCTYNEEIQNFANWYTYYRTRMNMMKSASTIAFSSLDDKYRVGFDNICQATGTTVKRGVAQFVDTGGEVANQRTNWWTQLTGASPSCATPLRAETAKIGRYFAGKLSGATDPLEYSCQQNFMILVTDGYWNENEPSATSITGGDIGNVDNSAATAPRPYYDGQQASTTCPTTGSARGSSASSCRTLADITWYYYSTDLRSSSNEVVITTASPHGLSPGQSYTISGVNPSGYNGTNVVFVTDSTHFGFSATSNPGAYVSGGTVNNGTSGITISAASYGAGRFSNATNAAGVDVSTNNVFVSADDPNQAQHMNFYAMGLGIDGQLEYRDDYQTSGIGDYAAIKGGTMNWPAVANLDPTGVDDLWHATVNGRGKYFSARNLPAVVAGLREALNKIGARVGSAAAAATSNLEPVAGDNFAYVASYTTQSWVGDVQSRSIDVLTGDVSADTGTKCGQSGTGCQWSAQAKLDGMTYSTRRIFMAPSSGAAGDPPRRFEWANLSGSEALYFSPSALSQYATLSVSNASDITADNLTKYLRGDRSLEMDGDISHPQIWRRRTNVMGDIVNTQPIFMKAPNGIYTDAGYANFKSTGSAASRNPVVFVSGQDGMLHALNAHTSAVTVSAVSVNPGEEMWAFLPTQVLPYLRKLADTNYGSTDPANANHHRYFVDGQITIADVNFGASDADWHTILIGGQGAGGTSYFALDVTDPLNPTYLWEFTDSRLGYTYANPIVTKLPNGEWAVLFSSGYNNSDGLGYLFAVNPGTGVIKSGFPMTTSSGTAGAPSNLGKIAVWATDPALNNTAEYVYAGDMNGDLWRFDLEPTATAHSGTAVFKLAHLAVGGVAQPITTKPEITQISSGTHIVYVGTGKYLESTDLTNTDVQSLYAVKDTLGADNLGTGSQTTWNPQTDTLPSSTNPAFIQRKLITTKSDGSAITQVINGATRAGRMICTGASATVNATTNTCANESSPTTMDWVTYGGWFVNFPDSGERMNVDTKLVRGTLVFAGNVPMASSCTVGGTSWVTAVDYSSGLAVAGAGNIVSTKIADSLVVGLTVVKLSSGEYKAIATKSNYQQETLAVPVASTTTTTSGSGTSNFGGKRGFWREFEAY